MSSSDPDSKIDFLDPPDAIRRKIKRAFCEEGSVEDNGVLAFVNAVLIPISQLRIDREKAKKKKTEPGCTNDDEVVLEEGLGDQRPFIVDGAPEGTVFSIPRDEKFGGPSHYASAKEIEDDFAERKLHPKDLKVAVADAIIKLLEPIRKIYEESLEWQEAEKLAYPDPNAKKDEGKKKKVREGFTILTIDS